MAAARRTPAGSRAGAGPAPRGLAEGLPRAAGDRSADPPDPYPRRHPAAVDGRISALAITMHAGSFRAAAGLATARPEVLARASITSPASWPPARCISMEPSRVLHTATIAVAA
jgi:hypothetical protein